MAPLYPLPKGPMFVFSDDEGFHICYNQDGGVIRQSIAHYIDDELQAKHIAAAINYCEGVPTKELESMGADAGFWGRACSRLQGERDALREENAALLAALKKIAKYKHKDRTCSLESQGYDQLECAEIGAKDHLALIAEEALDKIK